MHASMQGGCALRALEGPLRCRPACLQAVRRPHRRPALPCPRPARSPRGLVGNTLSCDSGQWERTDAGVGAGVDSFYEYLLKVGGRAGGWGGKHAAAHARPPPAAPVAGGADPARAAAPLACLLPSKRPAPPLLPARPPLPAPPQAYLAFGDRGYLEMFRTVYAAAMSHLQLDQSWNGHVWCVGPLWGRSWETRGPLRLLVGAWAVAAPGARPSGRCLPTAMGQRGWLLPTVEALSPCPHFTTPATTTCRHTYPLPCPALAAGWWMFRWIQGRCCTPMSGPWAPSGPACRPWRVRRGGSRGCAAWGDRAARSRRAHARALARLPPLSPPRPAPAPRLLRPAGQVEEGLALHANWTAAWHKFGWLPEMFDLNIEHRHPTQSGAWRGCWLTLCALAHTALQSAAEQGREGKGIPGASALCLVAHCSLGTRRRPRATLPALLGRLPAAPRAHGVHLPAACRGRGRPRRAAAPAARRRRPAGPSARQEPCRVRLRVSRRRGHRPAGGGGGEGLPACSCPPPS